MICCVFNFDFLIEWRWIENGKNERYFHWCLEWWNIFEYVSIHFQSYSIFFYYNDEFIIVCWIILNSHHIKYFFYLFCWLFGLYFYLIFNKFSLWKIVSIWRKKDLIKIHNFFCFENCVIKNKIIKEWRFETMN